MKVAVISRHSVANYGSLFQAHALQKVLETKIGVDAINIDYTPSNEKGRKLVKSLVNQSRWSKSFITKLAFYIYQTPSFSYTFKKFKEFRKIYLNQTDEEYTSSEMIKNNLPNADIFCTGSDQVWNILYDGKIDNTYFLDFLPDNTKRFSYAASFGGNTFEKLSDPIYKELLSKYNAISVREDSGIDILKDFSLNGKQVLDPTLLLEKEYWESLVPNIKKKEKYILIYQLRPNKEFDNYVLNFSKNKGLKLIRVSTMFFQSIKCGKFKYLPKPEEFLWLIKNADYFFTDSFHGTCFAINFGVNFSEILPGRFNARNQSLLRLVGLENRIITDLSTYDIPEKPIDFKHVYNKLEIERKNSIEFLKKSCKIGE